MGASYSHTPCISIIRERNEQARQCQRNGPCSRRISNIILKRVICKFRNKMPEPIPNTAANNEADTNANTCCLGKNFIPLSYTNRSADVYHYNNAYEPLENTPIVSIAITYDRTDRQRHILVINEGLYYGIKMNHTFLNPT